MRILKLYSDASELTSAMRRLALSNYKRVGRFSDEHLVVELVNGVEVYFRYVIDKESAMRQLTGLCFTFIEYYGSVDREVIEFAQTRIRDPRDYS